jgi:chromosome segregation ATPase
MGCAGSSAQYVQELQEAERRKGLLEEEIAEADRAFQAARQDEQNASMERLHTELVEAESHRDQIPVELAALRRRNEELHAEEERYREFMRQRSSPAVGSRAQPHDDRQLLLRADRALAVEREHADAAHRCREESTASEKQLVSLQEQLASLRGELSKAASDLQAQTKSQTETTGSSVSTSLERLLAEKRSDYGRSEQRWDDTEKLLHEQMKELRNELSIQEHKLKKQDVDLNQREKELTEVNSNLGNLQSLFDDVNHQLLTECARIEELQETVALCAKQGKELESLQSMLEESHRVLAQMRDALELERSERAKAAQALEQEQRRTQLLLDVLKHFKEKLQGLTPQMLLSRLGADAKAASLLGDDDQFLNSDFQKSLHGTLSASGNVAYLGGRQTPPTAGRSFGEAEASRINSRGGGMISPMYSLSNGMSSTIAPESLSFPAGMHGNPQHSASFPSYVQLNPDSSSFPTLMPVNGNRSGGLLRKQ